MRQGNLWMLEKVHLVHTSGGVTSWAAAKRVAERYGLENLWTVFADVILEDDDLYRFLIESTANIYGISRDAVSPVLDVLKSLPPLEEEDATARKLVLAKAREICRPILPRFAWISEGRTPWEVFEDVRFLGNSRVDPCSKILKRDFLDDWSRRRFAGYDVTHYLGFDWEEGHRAEPLRRLFEASGKVAVFPLYDWKKESKLAVIHEELPAAGITPPMLNMEGFPHNNCGGGCIKFGQREAKRLYEQKRKRFMWLERRESKVRGILGDVSILRDRTGGGSRTLSLRQFRERLTQGLGCDESDTGVCSCMGVVNQEEAAG